MSSLNLFDAIYSLRTVRRFRPDPVKDEDIRAVL